MLDLSDPTPFLLLFLFGSQRVNPSKLRQSVAAYVNYDMQRFANLHRTSQFLSKGTPRQTAKSQTVESFHFHDHYMCPLAKLHILLLLAEVVRENRGDWLTSMAIIDPRMKTLPWLRCTGSLSEGCVLQHLLLTHQGHIKATEQQEHAAC